MRVVFTADAHFCVNKSFNENAVPAGHPGRDSSYLQGAVAYANGYTGAQRADAFVDVGDRVYIQSCRDKGLGNGAWADAQNQLLFSEVLDELDPCIKTGFVDGNHDGAFSHGFNQSLLGERHMLGSHIIEGDDVRIVSWGAHVRPKRYEDGYKASDSDLDWLGQQLFSDDPRPVVLVAHLPLDNLVEHFDARDSFHSGQHVHHWFYANGKEIKDMILRSSKVPLVLNGHMHSPYTHLEQNADFTRGRDSLVSQTQFVRLPSLSERRTAGVFSVLDVRDDGMNLSMRSVFDKRMKIPVASIKIGQENRPLYDGRISVPAFV